MDTASSDFSSGCESGWTQYFVKSSSSESQRTRTMKMMNGEYPNEERNNCYGGEEDLSMVSDASSGPRQYNNAEGEYFNQNECSCYSNLYASERKLQKNKNGKQRDRSQLDDTASSHSKNIKQPSVYYNTSHGQKNSEASISKGKQSRKKYFGL